ncbi:hypothetical protein OAP65_04600 [Litorivicinus sp.]|nr:hypothetical protein [Litorivicinus sp.]
MKSKGQYFDLINRAVINLTQNCFFKLSRAAAELSVFAILLVFGLIYVGIVFILLISMVFGFIGVYYWFTNFFLKKLAPVINHQAARFNEFVEGSWGVKEEVRLFDRGSWVIGKSADSAKRYANAQFFGIALSNSVKSFCEFATLFSLAMIVGFPSFSRFADSEAILLSAVILIRMVPFIGALSVFISQLTIFDSVVELVERGVRN